MNPEDYFRELHAYELERRERFNELLSLPLGIITLTGGALYTLASNVERFDNAYEYLSIGVVGVGALLLIAACYELWKGAINKGYCFPAHADELHKYQSEVRKYETDTSNAEHEFSSFLTREFVRCASTNGRINDRRSEHHHKLKKRMILALATLGVAGTVQIGLSLVNNS